MINPHIQKYPAPEHLQEHIKGFCVFEFESSGDPMFVPAWAKTMLAFHYGEQFSFTYHDGTQQFTDKAIIIGCTTLPYMYNAPIGCKVRFITIEFHIETICSLNGIEMTNLSDRSELFSSIFKNIETDSTIDQLTDASNDKQKLSIVISFLDDFFKNIKFKKTSVLFNNLMKEIRSTKGIVQIQELSKKHNVSERHVSRVLSEKAGIPAKKLLQLIRIENSITQLYLNPDIKLVDLATEYGYYDQSHFIKEFKQTTSMTPSEMINSNLLESVRYMYC